MIVRRIGVSSFARFVANICAVTAIVPVLLVASLHFIGIGRGSEFSSLAFLLLLPLSWLGGFIQGGLFALIANLFLKLGGVFRVDVEG